MSSSPYIPLEKDFRTSVIGRRLSSVRRILPIMSSKGGVGKTLISVGLSLHLADMGARVGLLDLDITNPSAHIALGADLTSLPEEEKGVKPPEVDGVKFMTVAYYAKENPLPLRGWEIDNTLREVLAITIWGELDFLIIDTPPGMSDELLDILTFFQPIRPVVVATPSPLAMKSVERLLKLLLEEDVRPLGLVENMSFGNTTAVQELCRRLGVKYLGCVGMDPSVDSVVGDVMKFRLSRFFRDLRRVAEEISKAGGRD